LRLSILGLSAAMAPSASPGVDASLLRQVTCERITALLNGMGVVISKRQVVRLLTAKLETFRAEDEAVLKRAFAAPMSRSTIRGAPCRQEWLHHANWFLQLHDVSHRSSKSRLAFLSRLCGGVSLYVINDAALAYMEERNLPQIVIASSRSIKRAFSRLLATGRVICMRWA